MQVISAVAEFERDLLIERTQSGLKRAQAAGKHCGRRPAPSEANRAAVIARLDAGASVASLAKEFNTSRPTIMRIRDAQISLSMNAGDKPRQTHGGC
ncbi:helix-turn-helix domain-containing protein [Burkholderia multivorans]|nr:helix-turn-helix domain-containing protein [Burkholderia multivorans]